MAARKASTKAAVLEDETTEVEAEVEETSTEPTTKQLINEGIVAVIEATGIDVQKNRYKAMRAIAFQAFTEAIESGDFDDLVQRAIANVDSLPSGWEIERGEREAPAAKASPKAKAAPRKAAAKAPAKAAPARKRPAR
jgi:hypothetical protein